MSYKEFYESANEAAEERFELVRERVAQIKEETGVREPFADYFKKNAAFLQLLCGGI